MAGSSRAERAEGMRGHDPERTKADIVTVATEEFAENGLSGARVDAIAERTRTSKRMIYYYFGSKEGLYLAVLERAYAEIRALEAGLDLERCDPVEGLRRLIGQTFDSDEAHAAFIRLVTIENIHKAKHLAGMESIRQINRRVIALIDDLLARGRADGRFRTDVDAVDVHMMISALCFFRVANRHTFGAIFDVDLFAPERRAKHRQLIADAVVRALAPT
ncbi:TetR family transcriptional regulator [Methylobacterium nodulans]|uniref:Transcriptional regulator, TetR family n=1 Tax=Methylobacterium nodulans (strain LMG 21967 / CNCM I-2342 / ORS 2060) TaxID=460265 RepID=B8IUB8_METNO|nr:transcriptional regulator, TetR family [Methylobacterium nodulans ORS 2060]